jgi:hypothetical protein
MCKHPDTLTAEALSTYQPGWECICPDFNPYRCTCGANWTPREVYELRNMVLDLENQLSDQKKLNLLLADDLHDAKRQRDENELAKSDLVTTEKMLQNAEALISGLEIASKALLGDATRKALFNEARHFANEELAGGTQHYTTQYALEA